MDMTTMTSAPRRNRGGGMNIRKMHVVYGFLFASPWILGFLLFTLYPLVQAVRYSFMDYNILETPKWTGLENYQRLFTDPTVKIALYNTFYHVIFTVPLTIVVGLGIALLLNTDIRGIAFYRTLYYMPSIVPTVAAAVMFIYVFRPANGLLTVFVNFLGKPFGLRSPIWLGDPAMAKPSVILVQLWKAGSGLIIYLAGLKNISRSYYESAELDGAGVFRKFFAITIPLLTPTLLFQLVMGLISAFQIFTDAFVITAGGPNQMTYYMCFYIYDNAFKYWRMGYACTVAWLLFAIVMILTAINMWMSNKWVHYN